VTTYGDDSLRIFDMMRGGEALESPRA
jgi:hypothetical protein